MQKIKADAKYYPPKETPRKKKGKEAFFVVHDKLFYVHNNLMSYYHEGLEPVLSLRLTHTPFKGQILKGQYFDQDEDTIPQLMRAIETLVLNQPILIPLDLYNEHWAGLVAEREDDNLLLTYMDPENHPIPTVLEAKLRQNFAELAPENKIIIRQRQVETQKYGNCGPEVVENFIEHLTGQRVSQEAAVLLHSRLLEDHLLNRSTPTSVLAAEFPPKPSHEEEFAVLTPEGEVFTPQSEAEIKLRDQLVHAHDGGIVFNSAREGLAQGYTVRKISRKNDDEKLSVMAPPHRLIEAPFFDEKLRNQANHYVRTGVAFDTLRRAANIQPAENNNRRRTSSFSALGKSFRASL